MPPKLPNNFKLIEKDNYDYVLVKGDLFLSNSGDWIVVDGLAGSSCLQLSSRHKFFARKIDNNTNEPKEYIPPLPKGYRIVTDENHIVDKKDYYYLKFWIKNHGFQNVGDNWPQGTANTLKEAQIWAKPYKGLIMATQEDSKPRFPTKLPYPFGW